MPLQGITPVFRVAAPSLWVYGASAANTAQTLTIPAYVPGSAQNPLQTIINGIVASCSADASTVIALTVADAGVTVYEIDITLVVGVAQSVPLPGAITIGLGDAATVTLGAGASGCVTKLNVGYQYV